MATLKGGDSFMAKMEELARKVDQPKTLRVGFLEGALYPDGTSVAMVAAIQNYGAPSVGIPPRPFFSNVVAEKSEMWPDGMASLLKSTNFDVDETLRQTGEVIVGQIQDSIENGTFIPLKPSTIRARGVAGDTVYNPEDISTFGAKPLVHTGHMHDSVSYDIKSS